MEIYKIAGSDLRNPTLAFAFMGTRKSIQDGFLLLEQCDDDPKGTAQEAKHKFSTATQDALMLNTARLIPPTTSL